MQQMNLYSKIKSKPLLFFISVFVIISLITLLTSYQGSTDTGDYSHTAKYFAGKYSADIRSSHSFLYGLVHAPFLMLFSNFIIFKITNLIFIILISISIYLITKNKALSFTLSIVSPIFFYLAPWISPIIVSSFFFLWGFYFIERYDKRKNIRDLIFSGILCGVGLVFWDTVLHFTLLLAVTFLLDKRVGSSLLFIGAVILGASPRLIFDQIAFGFPFYTIFKNLFAGVLFSFFGSIYGQVAIKEVRIVDYLLILMALGPSFLALTNRRTIIQNKKPMIFIFLSILLILLNPQIRYVAIIAPIICVMFIRNMEHKKIKNVFYLSILVSLLFIVPYVIQITHTIDKQPHGADMSYMMKNGFFVEISKDSPVENIKSDLTKISEDFPNEIFVVFPAVDSYAFLAELYWGENIKELVSVQDYELWKGETKEIFEKKIEIYPKDFMRERRGIWIGGGLNKNINDKTPYGDIKYALSTEENAELAGFSKLKKYETLAVHIKE